MGSKLKSIIVSKKIDISNLHKKIVAVDASNIIMSLFTYTFKSRNESNFLIDSTNRVISHLYGLLFRINFYYSNKIFPIFCFDGKSSKRKASKDRLVTFKRAKKMYNDAMHNKNLLFARRIALSRAFMWPNIIEESKRLLTFIGIPCIESPSEAEAQCAELVKEKIAHCSISQDYDSLLFGCPYTVHNLTKSNRQKVHGKWIWQKKNLTLINLKKNLQNLQIDQYKLIDVSILVGTDFNKGINGIGSKSAYQLIKKYGSLESIIEKESDNFDFNQLTPSLITSIRRIFLFPSVIENFENFNFIWNYPDKQNVLNFLCKEHTLNREKVLKNLIILEKNYKSSRIVFLSKSLAFRNSIQKTL